MNDFVKSVGIIGHGQFGELLVEIFQKYSPTTLVKCFSRTNKIDQKKFFDLQEVVNSDLIIPAVSIRAFEEVIKQISPIIKKDSIVMDVTSVKLFPKSVMLASLPKSVKIICSHPMFGPGTYKYTNNSLKNLNWVFENVRSEESLYNSIIEFFKNLELNVVEMDAENHDKITAKSQFLTQVISLTFKGIDFRTSPIDTKSATLVTDLMEIVKADKELTKDMYRFNPYAKEELQNFVDSFNNVKGFITE